MRVSLFSRRWIAAGVLAGLISLVPLSALGAPPTSTDDVEDVKKQIQDLQEKVRRLERANSGMEDLVDDKIRQSKPVAGYKPGGFFIQNQKGDYVVRIGGYTQFDGRFFFHDHPGSTDQFLFRRVRPILEGSLGPYVDFKLMPDFAAGNGVTLFDAYVDLKPFGEWAKIRAGKFKPPVGLERLQSATAIDLVERGAPTNLVPNRDLGIEVWGAPWQGTIGYELGAFDFVPDLGNQNGNLGNDFTFAGRLFSLPFVTTDIDPLKGLGVGIAGSFGYEQGTQASPDLPQYKSFGQATIFRYVTGDDLTTTAIQNGNQSRWTPQAYYYFGPFSSLFEYVSSRTPVTLGDVSNTLNNTAWQIEAGWVLTGEDAGWRGVVPAHPFSPPDGQWGAFEVVARYDELNIDSDAFKLKFASPNNSVSQATGFGGGLNWYWNRNVKLMLDYYHTEFEKGQKGGTGNRPAEDVVIGRIQLQL